MLHIAGIGAGDEDGLTAEVARLLRSGLPIIFKTRRCHIAEVLENEGITFESLDFLFDSAEDFDALNPAIAEYVMGKAEGSCGLVFAVFGAGGMEDLSVREIIRRGAEVKMHPGLPLHAPAFAAPEAPKLTGFYTVSASDISSMPFGLSAAVCVTELFSPLCASQVKLRLLEEYPPEAKINYISVINGYKYEKIELLDIDRLDVKWYHHLACLLFVPSGGRFSRTLDDLDGLIGLMRGPGGCPWVRAQNHRSIRRDLLEECYEVLEAIDSGDMDKLADELGDMLLQVVFHSRFAAERGEFTLRDVIERECLKQVARTPYVFGGEKAAGVEESLRHWEAAKAREKGLSSLAERLEDVPKTLPALMYAQKVLKRANGADIPAFGQGTGDELLSIVNAAEARGEDAEEELRLSVKRLIGRVSQGQF